MHYVNISMLFYKKKMDRNKYSAPSLESRFLVKLIYPLHALELRSQKRIIHTYICLLQCGEGFNLISENLRILWLPQGT